MAAFLQRLFEYDRHDALKARHDSIVARVTGMRQRFNAADRHMGMELLLFLKEWLFEHISKVDRDYVPAFVGKTKRLWKV